jgi:hypothetical protein
MGKKSSVKSVRPGESFIQLETKLLYSPAWKSLSITARRVLDFLMVEHCEHGGHENGRLKAPYDQLVAKGGCSKNLIPDAIRELEMVRLIKVKRGGKHNGSNQPSNYTLTFVYTKGKIGISFSATNDWERVDAEKIHEYKKDRREQRKARKKRKARIKIEVTVPPKNTVMSSNSYTRSSKLMN